MIKGRISKKTTPRGVEVRIGQELVKVIPAKYSGIIRKRHLSDLTRIRLTTRERFSLELDLFLQDIKRKDKHVYDFIAGNTWKGVRLVNMLLGGSYYELIYQNGRSLRIPKDLFNLCPKTLPAINRNY